MCSTVTRSTFFVESDEDQMDQIASSLIELLRSAASGPPSEVNVSLHKISRLSTDINFANKFVDEGLALLLDYCSNIANPPKMGLMSVHNLLKLNLPAVLKMVVNHKEFIKLVSDVFLREDQIDSNLHISASLLLLIISSGHPEFYGDLPITQTHIAVMVKLLQSDLPGYGASVSTRGDDINSFEISEDEIAHDTQFILLTILNSLYSCAPTNHQAKILDLVTPAGAWAQIQTYCDNRAKESQAMQELLGSYLRLNMMSTYLPKYKVKFNFQEEMHKLKLQEIIQTIQEKFGNVGGKKNNLELTRTLLGVSLNSKGVEDCFQQSINIQALELLESYGNRRIDSLPNLGTIDDLLSKWNQAYLESKKSVNYFALIPAAVKITDMFVEIFSLKSSLTSAEHIMRSPQELTMVAIVLMLLQSVWWHRTLGGNYDCIDLECKGDQNCCERYYCDLTVKWSGKCKQIRR